MYRKIGVWFGQDGLAVSPFDFHLVVFLLVDYAGCVVGVLGLLRLVPMDFLYVICCIPPHFIAYSRRSFAPVESEGVCIQYAISKMRWLYI